MPILDFLQKGKAAEPRGLQVPKEGSLRDGRTGLYHAEYFNELLSMAKRTCERSQDSLLLMLADLSSFDRQSERQEVAAAMMRTLARVTRETDIKGWHVKGVVAGVIFTLVAEAGKDRGATVQRIVDKCYCSLDTSPDPDQLSRVSIGWHVYPDEFLETTSGPRPGSGGRTGRRETDRRRLLSLWAKRFVDVVGSLLAMVLLGPVLLAIPVLIKLDSRGPALFRQERIGLGGKRFVFLKFRSMYVDNDPGIHKAYMDGFIHADRGAGDGDGSGGTYKIKDDPRVTRLGRILRKTSLDELPQLFNVLKGDMSLVGPRPPIPYECQCYEVWHRRRVTEAKPGITGLWQVEGRSSLPFDEAVRIDIRYVRQWSLWLDLKIILRTPHAVVSCRGAY
jgi:lipopolysaccharide/colanic/teichoic acid biosynthesis glycosyltransferase